jgi:hypothetical protein
MGNGYKGAFEKAALKNISYFNKIFLAVFLQII